MAGIEFVEVETTTPAEDRRRNVSEAVVNVGFTSAMPTVPISDGSNCRGRYKEAACTVSVIKPISRNAANKLARLTVTIVVLGGIVVGRT